MTRRVECKVCHEEKEHKARGMCNACYIQEYRKVHPQATVEGLREELEYVAGQSAVEVAEAINKILVKYEASCRYEAGEVTVEIGGRVYKEEV